MPINDYNKRVEGKKDIVLPDIKSKFNNILTKKEKIEFNEWDINTDLKKLEQEIIQEIKLKIDESGYDYHQKNYLYKLRSPDYRLEETLEKLLVWSLWHKYNKYFNLSNNNSEDFKKSKLKEWWLDELIYINTKAYLTKFWSIDVTDVCWKIKKNTPLDEYKKQIQEFDKNIAWINIYKDKEFFSYIWEKWIKEFIELFWINWIKTFIFKHIDLFEIFWKDGIIKLIEIASKSWIIDFDLSFCFAKNWEELSDEWYIDLVKIIGEKWGKAIDLSCNKLWLFLSKEWILNLIKEAGKSGITYLDLRANDLYKLFWYDWFLEMLEIAAKYWIKVFSLNWNKLWKESTKKISSNSIKNLKLAWLECINLSYNELENIFEKNNFLEFINMLWNNSLKSINFSFNNLWKILWKNWVIKLVKIAWEKWVKNLDLSLCNLDILKRDWFFEIVEAAWLSWIDNLDLSKNWASKFL